MSAITTNMYPQGIKEAFINGANLELDKMAILDEVLHKGMKKDPLTVEDLAAWHKKLTGTDLSDPASLQPIIGKINETKFRRTNEVIEMSAEVFLGIRDEPLARLVIAYINAKAQMPVFVLKKDDRDKLSQKDPTALKLFFAEKIKEYLFRNNSLAELTAPLEGSNGIYRNVSDGTIFRHEWTDLLRVESAWKKAMQTTQ